MTIIKKPGNAAQLYRNTATFASPVWSACAIQSLHFINKPANSFDSSDRTIPVNSKIPTRYEWSIEGEFLWASGDANLAAIVAAATTGAAIDMAVSDDAIATSQTKALHAWWAVESGWDNDANLAEGQKCKFKLVPHGNCSGNAPEILTTA